MAVNTRLIALDTLMIYEKEGKKLRPLLFDVLKRQDALDRRDRAFIKVLTEGVVERRIALDWIIDQVSERKTGKIKPVIRMILREGIYQLLFMDHVPDRAAVSEAVKLVRIKHIDGLTGFVNGALRSVIRYRDDGICYPDIETEYSIPMWIAERFHRDYGNDRAEVMIKSGAGSQPLYIRVNRRLTDRTKLSRILEAEGTMTEPVGSISGSEAPGFLPFTLKVKEGSLVPAESESFRRGLYSIQDLSSQTAMYELWDTILGYIKHENKVDINIIDLCAAPGGKSCYLAESLDGISGELSDIRYRITAFDISEDKLGKIRENAERTACDKIMTAINDASVFNLQLEQNADVVIADLPCSGFGVIDRKVDIKYNVVPDDIVTLCKLQRQILDNAVRYLKDNGILLFSVCTVTQEETVSQSEYIASLGLHKIKEQQLIQGVDPCDGFYYSIWRK